MYKKIINKIDDEISRSISNGTRQSFWTESIAVGEADFLESIKNEFGSKARCREIQPTLDGSLQLKEAFLSYSKPSENNLIPLKPPF